MNDELGGHGSKQSLFGCPLAAVRQVRPPLANYLYGNKCIICALTWTEHDFGLAVDPGRHNPVGAGGALAMVGLVGGFIRARAGVISTAKGRSSSRA